MSYNRFTYKTVGEKLGLSVEYDKYFDGKYRSMSPRPILREWLAVDENYPLTSEMARRELLTVNVFRELIYQTDKAVSVYSAEVFDVDPALGLTGEADYLITLGKAKLPLEAPVIAVAEAKKNEILTGVGQCIAEMYAAFIFNERKGKPVQRIFGVVTTGSLWGFLVLEGKTVKMDPREYLLSDLDEILGVLIYMTKNVY